MKDAPNYQVVATCTTCKHACVDYDWYVKCGKFKDAGSDHCVCDDYQLADGYKDGKHAELKVAGGELIPDRAFVGGEIRVGDELIIKGIVMPKPFIEIFKGNKVSISVMGGEEVDYIVVSIDKNGMTVKEVD